MELFLRKIIPFLVMKMKFAELNEKELKNITGGSNSNKNYVNDKMIVRRGKKNKFLSNVLSDLLKRL